MPSRTNLKLAEVIRHRAAHVILHELKDPRIGFVTITRVRLAADLVECTIYWSVIGDEKQRVLTYHALEHARSFIQRRVAEGLRTRNAPHLAFEYDESVQGAIRMGDLLKKLKTERGDEEDAPATDVAADAGAGAAADAPDDADAVDDADDADAVDDADDADDSDNEGDEGDEGDRKGPAADAPADGDR